MGDGNDSEDIRAGLTVGRHRTDVLSASKVVIGVVRDKYKRRVRKLEQQQEAAGVAGGGGIMQAMWNVATGAGKAPQQTQQRQQQPVPVMPGTECPMLDGSVDTFYPYWDETFSANHLGPSGVGRGGGISRAFDGGSGGDGMGSGDAQGQQQQQQQQPYPDLWSTISMDWAQEMGGGML